MKRVVSDTCRSRLFACGVSGTPARRSGRRRGGGSMCRQADRPRLGAGGGSFVSPPLCRSIDRACAAIIDRPEARDAIARSSGGPNEGWPFVVDENIFLATASSSPSYPSPIRVLVTLFLATASPRTAAGGPARGRSTRRTGGRPSRAITGPSASLAFGPPWPSGPSPTQEAVPPKQFRRSGSAEASAPREEQQGSRAGAAGCRLRAPLRAAQRAEARAGRGGVYPAPTPCRRGRGADGVMQAN